MILNLAPIHVIGLVLSFALLYQSVRLVRKRKESVFEFLLWTGFGVALLVLSLGSAVTITDILEISNIVLSYLGFGTGTFGIIVLALLSILMMLFYTYVNVKTNRQLIYDLNQQLALEKYESSEAIDDKQE